MQRLIEGRHSNVDLVLRTEDGDASHHPLRAGLGYDMIVCRLKRGGVPSWQHKELCPASWRDCGHGVYTLSLAPEEFASAEHLLVLLDGTAELRPRIVPELLTLAVEPPRPSGALAIPRTILCGHVVTLAQVGKPKAVVSAKVAQFPLVLGSAGFCSDVVTTECDEDGYFELPIVTGAFVNVTVPAINYTRQFVVPPPPAPGVPVRLFTL